jgi:hypothetical protein
MYIQTYTDARTPHTHTRARTHARTHARSYARTHTHARTHIRTPARTHDKIDADDTDKTSDKDMKIHVYK